MSELHPKSTSCLVESCHNYERLKQTIIYHAVTRVCFEISIVACGPGLSQICQQCWSVPKVLVAAAKKKSQSLQANLVYYC